MLKISELYIHPIKSLGGISVCSAEVTDRGLKYDRRWLLVDSEGIFLTQRSHPRMALLSPIINSDFILVTNKKDTTDKIEIPIEPNSGEQLNVKIWNDFVDAEIADIEINNWFSNFLGLDCRLVYMPDESKRIVDKKYAPNDEIVSFADGYPFLLIGQSSLDDLNSKLESPVPMQRFRPNFVFEGGEAFEEDKWYELRIGEITFYAVKPCARCVVTTINQDNAEKNKEPLATLSKYRKEIGGVMFGQNLIHKGSGKMAVGDEITIISLKENLK